MPIQSPEQNYDVVVVGGGMVGASFACALDRAMDGVNISILVVEAVAPAKDNFVDQPSFDARSTAISYGSSRIYQRMGIWQPLSDGVTPIKKIHVSDRGRFGSAQLSHEDHQLEALGYVVENRKLGEVLNSAMQASETIDLICPASISTISPNSQGMTLEIVDKSDGYSVNASLVVLADGGRSPICNQLGIERDVEHYKQHALIANIAFEYPHNNVAYERFTETGPLAVLPLQSIENQNRGSMVWTIDEQQSAEFMAMEEDKLLPLLQGRFGNRLGELQQIGEKFCYPLSLSIAKEQVRPGLVLLGNVAHTLHPVAGQGLNLALRDVGVLVETLKKANLENKPPGEMSVLQEYVERQKFDQQKSITFTDIMTRLFSSNSNAKVWARKFGLLSVELAPTIKRSFAEQAMGLGGK